MILELARPGLPSSSELWRRAFEIYNHDHDYKLGMNCRSCYYKVAAHLIKKL